jgi:hypothetical protein
MVDLRNKPLNKKICKQNLFLLKQVFDEHRIPFRLGYGTLLGAVRDNDFIAWDNDIDLVFDKVNKPRVVACLPELFKLGFVERGFRENFWGINRKGERCDIYFFSQTNILDKLRDLVVCKYGAFCVYIDKFYWDESTAINFLGKSFSVYKNYEMWLSQCYGADWRVPQVKKGNAKTFLSHYVMYFLRWGKKRVPYDTGEKVLGFYRKLVK